MAQVSAAARVKRGVAGPAKAGGGSPAPAPSPATGSIPIPIVPVRGSVVLPNLRTAPQPPKNAVRTRKRGELVYDGPSVLLRERAHAIYHAEGAARAESESRAGAVSGGSGHGGGVQPLQFESAYGYPHITTLGAMERSYNHVVLNAQQSLGSIGAGIPEGGGSIASSVTMAGAESLREERARQRLGPKTAMDNRPRFPIR